MTLSRLLTATAMSLTYGSGAAASLVASTYFAGYHTNQSLEVSFQVADMPWDKYTDAKYAFAYVPMTYTSYHQFEN